MLRLDRGETIDDLFGLMRKYSYIFQTVFSLNVSQDMGDTFINSLYLSQSKAGMSQGYYLKNDSATQRIQEQYIDHIQNVSNLLGQSWNASSIYDLETKVEAIMLAPSVLRRL